MKQLYLETIQCKTLENALKMLCLKPASINNYLFKIALINYYLIKNVNKYTPIRDLKLQLGIDNKKVVRFFIHSLLQTTVLNIHF